MKHSAANRTRSRDSSNRSQRPGSALTGIPSNPLVALNFKSHPLSRFRGMLRKNRLLSVACYLGLAPFLWFLGVNRQQNPLLKHHLAYSLAYSFLSLLGSILSIVMAITTYVINVYTWGLRLSPGLVNLLDQTITWIETMIVLFMLLFSIAWTVSLAAAWRGRIKDIPYIRRIASNNGAMHLAVYWTLLSEVLLVIMVYISASSVQIASRSVEKADVYLLYTVGGYIAAEDLNAVYTPPRWTIAAAFYPLLQAGINKWGEDSVSILPLSEATFREAIQNGRFVFVASHGGSDLGSFTISYAPYRSYGPADVLPGSAGNRLQYVYFGGCDTGDSQADWERVLAPAEIKSFDRISFVSEHLLWVWFKSPGIIAGLN